MKKLILLALATGLLGWSCQGDDPHGHGDGPYFVTIDIQSPEEGATVPVGEPLYVKVVFTRPDEQLIHNIRIDITDMNNNVVKKLFDFHVHEPGIYIYESQNYTPEQAGSFKVQAVTTDMEWESPNLKEAGFVVQ